MRGVFEWRGYRCKTETGLSARPGGVVRLGVFETELGQLAGWVKSSRVMQGFEEVLLPGEPEARALIERGRDGVAIDETTWKKICDLARARQVAIPEH